MHVLVTGVAGFIGFHCARRLLAEGCSVVGIDNLNDYYDVRLKKDRLAEIESGRHRDGHFRFVLQDLADSEALRSLFDKEKFSHVINLAAQAGVRYSLQNPKSYIASNLTGFGNILECCRHGDVQHLVFASSSSVYGLNTDMPYSTERNADHPASLYAATKKSNELMAHAYSHLFRIPCTGVRFFTVYGPWGRPDMAPYLFASAILSGRPIKVFNYGHMRRDFTYIDDAVDGLARLLRIVPAPAPDFDPEKPNPSSSSAPWRIYNIGNSNAVELNEFISLLEAAFGKKAEKEFLPMQPGDVEATFADIHETGAVAGFTPKTPLSEGLARFAAWYREYYK